MGERDLGRIEEARRFTSGLYLGITHELDGANAHVGGNERTYLLFERTYLRGLVDMAVHLLRGGSIAELATTIDHEIRGLRTGEIETGVLHIRPVDLDLTRADKIDPELEATGRGGTD